MALGGPSEADLARRCRRGDPVAWREMVRRFSPLVYRLAFGMLRSESEAEDATQEVFLRMHRSFDTFDSTRPMAPWVARTAYHACLRRLEPALRRLSAGGEAESLEAIEDPAGASPEREAERQEALGLLARALAELPAQDRALLDLRYREGLSDAEVSEVTGMPVNTVKTRIFRARRRLRARLAPLLEGS